MFRVRLASSLLKMPPAVLSADGAAVVGGGVAAYGYVIQSQVTVVGDTRPDRSAIALDDGMVAEKVRAYRGLDTMNVGSPEGRPPCQSLTRQPT